MRRNPSRWASWFTSGCGARSRRRWRRNWPRRWARAYERTDARRGYRYGRKARTLTGPTGPLALTLPRGVVFAAGDATELTSRIVLRCQRRMGEVNEAVVATYLAGGNTWRIRGALTPLLKAAPLSR